MAELTVQKVLLGGLDPVYSAADVLGDTFANDGKLFLHVKNGDASPKTVTIDSVAQCSHGFDHDIAVTIPASDEKLIGPFPAYRFNDANGKVKVTYSAITSVTVATFKY